jgi:hypothetical protein
METTDLATWQTPGDLVWIPAGVVLASVEARKTVLISFATPIVAMVTNLTLPWTSAFDSEVIYDGKKYQVRISETYPLDLGEKEQMA